MKKRIYLVLLMVVGAVSGVFSQSMIITGGNDHGIALCSKGQIFAWGYNAGNRLCLVKTEENYKEPIAPSPCLVNTGTLTFSQLSGGSGGHSVALSCKKVVYCWGNNENMQCGREKSKYIEGGKPVPVYCGEAPGYDEDGTPGGEFLGNVKYISATTAASMAILDDGTGRVVIWGGNLSGGGGVIETPTYKPVFIKDSDGQPIRNVIHITGGDNNVLLIVGETADAKVGTVYSIGNWNGRGGNGETESFVALPVEIGDGTGKKSSKKYLTGVRTAGIADVGAFAVDGETGYVYGWGNGGWGCSNGLPNNNTTTYAEKVVSGEYKEITGEAYLTDVVQVVGGNGNGAAVTKEGYVLYWGTNKAADPSENSGGVIPNSKYKSAESTCKTGPVFANYCKGEHGKDVEHRVDDAVAIARGDLYGFMVNSSGEFYVWGSTARPSNEEPKHVGALGIGEVKCVSTCFRNIPIVCSPQDLCPEAFMLPKMYKCPGDTSKLYCGFTPLNGTAKNYFFKWSRNGVVLNSSNPTKPEEKDPSDIYDSDTIKVTLPGLYRVDIVYIGMNVPCDNCPETYAECELIEMKMPITPDTIKSCVAEPLDPKSSDNVCFSFKVNENFYKTGTTTWKVYEKKEGGTALKELDLEVNEVGEFCVPGDKVTTIPPKSAPIAPDTLYTIYVEDATKQKGVLFEKSGVAGASKGQLPKADISSPGWQAQPFYMYLEVKNDVMLETAKLTTEVGWDGGEISITPYVHKVGTDDNGNVVAQSTVYKKGKTSVFTVPSRQTDQTIPEGTQFTADIDFGELVLEGNPARSVGYFIFFDVSASLNSAFLFEDVAPITDKIDGASFVVKEVGQANSLTNFQSNGKHALYDITYSKLTSYNCGRIALTSKYWCPPCKRPDATSGKYVSITSSETPNATSEAVELCKESDDLKLNVEALQFESKAANKLFDILWSDRMDDWDNATSANADELEFVTKWADVMGGETENDVEKWYYVMVRDNEKPTAAACFVYDSIKVIAHQAPLDTLANIEFCVGTLEDEPDLTIEGKTINWGGGAAPTGIKDMTASDSFVYTVTDDETGCEGEEHTLVVTVNSTDVPDVSETVGILKKPNSNYSLNSAVNTAAVAPEIIRWYDDAMNLLSQSDAKVSQADAGEYVFFATMYNTETECESDTVRVTVTVNDAPTPTPHNEHLCVGDSIKDMSVYADLESSEYEFRWYTDPNAEKGSGDKKAPTFKATAAGVTEIYVSQINKNTGAESEKSTIKITVHEVATLDLSDNITKYCVSSTETAKPLKFKSKNDGDLTESDLVWSVSETMSPSSATMTPDITVAKVTPYYIQPVYVNANSYAGASNASAVCKGEVQKVDITVNSTDKPVTTGLISYVKNDGVGGGFKHPTKQDPTAIDTCSDCKLIWYDMSGNEVANPTPNYADVENLEGTKEYQYQIAQKNTVTGCISELEDVKLVISAVPAPFVKPMEYCELGQGKIDTVLSAEINVPRNHNENEYELIWYPTTADGAVDESNPSVTPPNLKDYANILKVDGDNEKEHDYFFGVVQQIKGDATQQSPMATIRVTIYARPRLKPGSPDPICKGESVDLKNHYDYSNRLILGNVKVDARFQGGESSSSSIVKEEGTYSCQCYFELVKGNGTTEVCYSDWGNIKVIVDMLNAKIKGATTTCPNVEVVLESEVKSNVDKDKWVYNWESSNSESGIAEVHTVSAGLDKPSRKVTTKLTVEAGKCKVTTDAWTITVGDGPVVGNIVFTESDNNKSGDVYTLSETGPVFASCGGSVSVGLKDVNCTEGKFSYSGPESGSGTFTTSPNATSTEEGALLGDASFNVTKPGIYTVTYTNKCDAKFRFEIVNASVTAKETRNAIEMCDGERFKSEVTVTPATPSISYVINWEKDGTTIANTGKELEIAQTKVSDSGKYTYTVSSEGCVFEGKVALGVPLTVKPNIAFNSSLVSEYEVIREEPVTMSILFDVPDNASDVSAISGDILWTEDGETANTGEQYAIASVDKNHEYVVKVNPDGYCGASTKVVLKVDAKLMLTAEMLDVDNEQMCLNEDHTLTIDTTGTGKILHPSDLKLKLEEEVAGSTVDITNKLAKNGKLLVAKISPKADAQYKITYTYARGTQDESTTLNITVHQPFDIAWKYEPSDAEVCEGDAVDVIITKMEPNDGLTTLTWDMSDEDITFSDAVNGNATITPRLTNSAKKQTKKYVLTAKNGICKPKEYYPQVTVDKPIEGAIKAPERVCEGHDAVLDASSFEAETYSWTSDQFAEGEIKKGAVITVSPRPESAVYGLYMTRGKCVKDDEEWSLWITYAPMVDTVLDYRNSQMASDYGYRAARIDLAGGMGSEPFVFVIDGKETERTESFSYVCEDIGYGIHTVLVKDDAGCEATHAFSIPAPEVTIPSVLSPNGDGRGDRFEIPVLQEAYPDAEVHIYDRWGKELASYKASDEGWDGTYQGKMLPSTDYWYEVKIEEIEQTYVGHFTLIRQ